MKEPSFPILLVGCGILKKEINSLISRNGWPVDTVFLDSMLHIDFEKLSCALTATLEQYSERNLIVFYGACHPRMEAMLDSAKTFRMRGQNCVEMLLGPTRYTAELKAGAFFLLEEWANCWEPIITDTFGPNRQVMREIINGDRNYLLGLKTPCSANFEAVAEEAGKLVGLPLRWMEVTLGHLEKILSSAIEKKTKERIRRNRNG